MAEPAALRSRVPIERPALTLSQLRNAIPPHCFQRSLARSTWELTKDVAVCSALFYASSFIDSPAIPRLLSLLLWPLYWFWQGAFATGIWVLAHECGHGAFSESKAINDTVGLIFHSLLLVPYFSWKHSHRRHHQNTGSLDRDEVFVPKTRMEGVNADMWGQPLYRLGFMVVFFLVGWPIYLTTHAGGRQYERFTNHFDPSSPLFNKSERHEVIFSDVGLVVALAGLGWLAHLYGVAWLIKVYVVPLLIVNFWLVMITMLQHTHPHLPHYDASQWEWLRGALSTVDRSYGFLDHIFHHITDTHVVHHLFSQLPHYHAQEATRAVIPVLGDYYARDDRNIFAALWADFAACYFVAAEQPGVYWYRNTPDAPTPGDTPSKASSPRDSTHSAAQLGKLSAATPADGHSDARHRQGRTHDAAQAD